ncbi:MAG: MarC family protein [Candidatus Bathyarchaeales archaeon]
MGIIEFALIAVTSIVAIMEPFSTIAVYITLTRNMEQRKQRKIAAKSMKISFLALIFFALTGHLLFLVFNITDYAFKIAGGILLIAVSLRMLYPGKGEYSTDEREDVAIVPLAFPLTAGPGTITTVMLLVSEANNFLEASFVFVGITIGILISYVGMIYSSKLFKLLGEDGLRVVTALMSILILAIAIQFIINGAAEAVSQIFSK